MAPRDTPSEQQQAFGGVIDVLEAIGAVYAIWGGWAVIAYGEPHFTPDMDLLLSPRGFLPELFVKRLHETGYRVDGTTVLESLAGGTFSAVHTYTRIKCAVTVPGEDALLQKALREAAYLPFDETRQALYVSAEAAVATKLRSYAQTDSTRHLDDIASVVRVQGKRLDNAEIDVAAGRMAMLGVWRAIWEANT